MKRLLALSLLSSAFTANVVAENWIPIRSGGITIFIPGIQFVANEVNPQQYSLNWIAQSGATSYKVERLSVDPDGVITSPDLPTKWVEVANVTDNSYVIDHDITSFDLGGHQTYRLSSCEQQLCSELDTVSYFIVASEMNNTIPQNFSLTATPVYGVRSEPNEQPTSKRQQIAAANDDNPYAWGHGYSMISGHGEAASQGSNKDQSLWDKIVAKGKDFVGRSSVMTSTQVDLTWDLVPNASHYVIVRDVIKVGSPTKSFLENSSHKEWAVANAYTYELVAGEFEFSVYACFEGAFSDRFNPYCGGASQTLQQTVVIDSDPNRIAQNIQLSGGAVVAETQSYHLTWQPPVDIDTNEVLLTGYQVFGELSGLIATVDHGQTLSISRNNGQSGSPYLVPGREYCYKIVPQYTDKSTGQTVKGVPGYPTPNCVAIGTEPVLAAPSYLSIFDQLGETQMYGIGYHFTWGEVAGADYYQLDREVNYGQGDWHPVYVGEEAVARQYLLEARNEAFRVSACTNDGRCGNYRRIYFWAEQKTYTIPSTTNQPACIHVPQGLKVGETADVQWCAPHNSQANEFSIAYLGHSTTKALASSFAKTDQGLYTTPFTVLADSDGSYCFDVAALYSGDATEYKTAQYCGYMPPVAPAQPSIAVENVFKGDYVLSWSAIDNANQYKVQEAQCGESCATLTEGDWQQVASTYSTSKTLYGKSGAKYGFRVAACKDIACGEYSPMVTIESRKVRFIHTDSLGSPALETDEVGAQQ